MRTWELLTTPPALLIPASTIISYKFNSLQQPAMDWNKKAQCLLEGSSECRLETKKKDHNLIVIMLKILCGRPRSPRNNAGLLGPI